MEDFQQHLFIPLAMIIFGGILEFIKAHLRKSPLSKSGEFIKYNKQLAKPIFYGFITMFILVFFNRS